jgi:pyridoxine 5-phosphate synthase
MLNGILQTRMNLEMAVTDEMLAIAERIKPADVCLVPERREELTTEGGLDVAGQLSRMVDACARMNDANIRTSLFIDADIEQLEAAKQAGAPVVEIHTGHFADASSLEDRHAEMQKIIQAVNHGVQLGLQVNAGHGLHYHNVSDIAALTEIRELNIGHSIIARAVFTGLQAAVKEMKQLMQQARRA